MPQIDRFFFRAGGSSASPGKLVADELRLGFTWADVTPPAPPELKVAPAGNACVLFWPTNAPVFVLQGTPSLTPPPTWMTETASPTISGTHYVVVVQATNAARFFRLRQHE